jgi:mono/diheme cytochrome c family protein
MKSSWIWTAVVGLGALAALVAADRPAPPSKIDRGAYLVHHVAMCVNCHSPRDEKGDLINTRLLSGAPIPVSSPYSGQVWAYRAPNIRGLVGYTDEEGERLLMEGVNRNGARPRPPMEQFGMNREDAEAVVAYLRSLK